MGSSQHLLADGSFVVRDTRDRQGHAKDGHSLPGHFLVIVQVSTLTNNCSSVDMPVRSALGSASGCMATSVLRVLLDVSSPQTTSRMYSGLQYRDTSTYDGGDTPVVVKSRLACHDRQRCADGDIYMSSYVG
jgi:hypothetical protein